MATILLAFSFFCYRHINFPSPIKKAVDSSGRFAARTVDKICVNLRNLRIKKIPRLARRWAAGKPPQNLRNLRI
jgi:hypothetical protein